MITQLQIEYFLAINETKNISRAAKQLLIAPQTLSRSLESIERDLNARLFERGTPLALTDSGRIFLSYAQEMVDKRNNLVSAVNDITGNICGTIRLGISYNRSPVLLPETISEFETRYPKIDFFIFEGNQSEIKHALLTRKIDLAVEHIPFGEPGLVEEAILSDQLYLLIPKELLTQHFGERAAAVWDELRQGKSISILENLPFLLNKRGNSIRSIMESIFRQEQMQPLISTETENMETLFNMSVIGRGVTVYPGAFLSKSKLEPYMDVLHIARVPHKMANFTLGVTYRKGYYLSQASRDFIELLKCHARRKIQDLAADLMV